MKTYLAILLLATPFAHAEDPAITTPSGFTTPESFGAEQIDSNDLSLKILTGWGLANLAGGLVMRPIFNEDQSQRYFYEMNAIYGGINLAIGILGLHFNGKERDEAVTDSKALLKRGLRYERIYWINAGIDVGVVMLGVALRNKSGVDANSSAKWDGYGQAFMLQGLFLLVLDTVLALRHRDLNDSWIDSPRFAFTPTGFAMRF